MNRPLRVLLCLSAKHTYYETTDEERATVKEGLRSAFWELGRRFEGVEVLGSMDDDLLAHGASQLPNYRAYILLDAPSLETVVDLCALVKETIVGGSPLWRWVGIDARVGRPLPFVEV